MEKTEMVHIRISPKLKRESEEVLNDLGINISYAISMFLTQLVHKQGFPFDIVLPKNEESEKAEKLASAIN